MSKDFWLILGVLLLLHFSFEIGMRVGRAEVLINSSAQKEVDAAIEYLRDEKDAGKG